MKLYDAWAYFHWFDYAIFLHANFGFMDKKMNNRSGFQPKSEEIYVG